MDIYQTNDDLDDKSVKHFCCYPQRKIGLLNIKSAV